MLRGVTCVHHGETDPLVGAAALGRYLGGLASSFPELRVVAEAPIRPGRGRVAVPLILEDPRGAPPRRLLAVAKDVAGRAREIEIFGPGPRLLAGEAPSDGSTDAADIVVEADAVSILAAAHDAEPHQLTSIDGGVLRDVLRTDDATVVLVDMVAASPQLERLIRHIAVVGRYQDGEIVESRVYGNPREGSVVEMSNQMSLRAAPAVPPPPAIEHWGPVQTFCCEQGSLTRTCTVAALEHVERCRGERRLPFECRQAYDCDGPACFCCASELDGACGSEPAPVRRGETPPPSRRPNQPAIWSPHRGRSGRDPRWRKPELGSRGRQRGRPPNGVQQPVAEFDPKLSAHP